MVFDCIIIGCGLIGASVSRYLSRYKGNILVLERHNDVGEETSSANSSIVHSGYDPKPGTLKAKFNVLGNKMMSQVSEELDVPFIRNGSLTVAFSTEEAKTLYELKKRSEENGVECRIVETEELRKIEPNISSEAKMALLCPTAGIINPFLLNVGYIENAMDNGVKLRLNSEVVDIKYIDGLYHVYLKNGEEYNNYLINAVNSKQEVSNYINELDLEVQQIKKEINQANLDTDYKKILYVHDWIVNNSKYDETLNKENRSNIYGILKEKEATCGGYAKTFKYLMDKLNINCIIVQGKATNDNQTEYHAWNYVELDGKWYGIDCTWDDPIIEGNVPKGTQRLYHTYFLKGQNVFNQSHEPLKNFYGTNLELNYPELEENDYIINF